MDSFIALSIELEQILTVQDVVKRAQDLSSFFSTLLPDPLLELRDWHH